jgi:peptidoglycan/LPS O-acetylase OafA/YrhL
MVVAVHCVACWMPMMQRDPAAGILGEFLLVPLSGRAPVILFFVLSGFVLSEALAAGFHRPRWLAVFYARRLLRIVPAAYAGLLAMLLAIWLADNWLPSRANLDLPDWITNYFHSARPVNLPGSLLFLDNHINPVYWTLHVELAGSLALPFFFWLIHALPERRRAAGAAALVALLLLLPALPYRFATISHMTSQFLFCFPLGMLVHLVTAVPRGHRAVFSRPAGWLALLVLLLAHAVIGPGSAAGRALGSVGMLTPMMGADANAAAYLQHLVEAFAAAVLVGSVAVAARTWSALGNRAAVWLGEISYSLYVIHFPVLVLAIAATARLWHGPWAAHTWAAPFVTLLLVFPASVLLSIFLYRSIEKPAIEAGKKLSFRAARAPGVTSP